MIIDCISDLHGHYPELEGGDLLIIAGDLTANDNSNEWEKCDDWLRSQKYKYKKVVVVAGNHDSYLYDGYDNPFHLPFSDYESDSRDKIPFATYLCDSGTEILYHPYLDPPDMNNIGIPYKRKTLKIWGSPWTKRFPGMNPKCMAFTCETDEELDERWALIPDDTDILITHSPPYGMFDCVNGKPVGSESLLLRSCAIKPMVHIFGHVHEQYGECKIINCLELKIEDARITQTIKDTIFVNASHVNERYKPVNKPIRIVL